MKARSSIERKSGWASSICSSRVVPERGKPTTNTGLSSARGGGSALRVGIGVVEHGLPPLRRGGMIAVAHAQLRARVPDIVVQVAICIGRRRDGIEGNLRELRSGLVELIAALKQQAELRGKA